MKFISPPVLARILADAANTIVTIKFIKRTNGEARTLNGLLHVKKYVTGRGAPYVFADYGLFTIFDLEIAKTLPPENRAKSYRCFGYESVYEITAGGTTHKA